MNTHYPSPLQVEWTTLQQDHERHERCAVGIKLAAVALAAFCTLFGFPIELSGTLLAVVWLIEAMLRTVQARLAQRILRVEGLLEGGGEGAGAFRFHSEWQAGRPGGAGLIAEYLGSALRPTVAFPHAVLLALQLAMAFTA
ncbi:hypothetical protein [Methyloversatilis thermotolerans]|uniref:hypothetical protein n=1 Tax=Methyloversatilis thermotolerans TaxID=1346290 RepID=UPI000381FDC7|nr:hypothetical protein [Methyloversatilis thermotolerans]